ncbi:MAG: zinc-binding dehydrogenase [Cyclobacteriaceae bacterium]|nr:zinc-binding dehydrogenase [Cyclobacteriaceae bacterium]
MEKMKAICLTPDHKVKLNNVPMPQKAEPGYLIIKVKACGINSGDKAFIAGAFPPGSIPVSLHDICGVSGAGKVIEVGDGVPQKYKGKNVAVYKSLKFSDKIVGTWSEYAHMHYHHCVILPDNVNMEEYSGSLVNSITPYAFLKQITEEGHKGIICTAGNSATGCAMLGICLANNVPIISIVRNEKAKKYLEKLDAPNILVQSTTNFNAKLEKLSNQIHATAVFDGVGGELISRVAKILPRGSSIYTYGFLGGDTPLCIHTSMILMKGLTIKGFGNFTSETVKDPKKLEEALNDLSEIIDRPHFKTKVGKIFKLKEIDDAIQFSSDNGSKAVLSPSL